MENSKNKILRRTTKEQQAELPIEKNQVIRKIKLIPKNDTVEEKIPTHNIKILLLKKPKLKPKSPEIIKQTCSTEEISDEDEGSIDNDEEICSNGFDNDKETVKVIKKTVTKIDNNDPTTIPQIEGSDIVSEYTTTMRKTVSDEELSKEEMIEKVEYQRDVLVKNRDKYSEKDYALKLSTIDKLLSKLREELDKINLATLNDKRIQIDKIVLEKKMPKDQFKKKIDLTGEHDDKDPSMNLVTSSRKYFEKMAYLQQPPEIAKMDPKRNKNFGNQSMPPDILKTINFS